MFKSISGFFSETRAVTAVELSLVFIPFIASIFFIFEMCRVAYISSSVDIILAESAQMAAQSTNSNAYTSFFNKELTSRINRWPLFSRDAKTTIAVSFCPDVNAVIQEQCSTTISDTEPFPLALYRVSVNYNSLFLTFVPSLSGGNLTRSILVVQESQR